MPSRLPLSCTGTYQVQQEGDLIQEHDGCMQSIRDEWTRVTGEDIRDDLAITKVAVSDAGMRQDMAMSQTRPQDSNFDSTQASTSASDVQMMRKVITSLPRPQTFHRQQSEKRERLLPVPISEGKRQAESTERKQTRGCSDHAPPQSFDPTPDLFTPSQLHISGTLEKGGEDTSAPVVAEKLEMSQPENDGRTAGETDGDIYGAIDGAIDDAAKDDAALQQEFRDRWILNLSMHFRDKSNREKFFITYAQSPNMWRRMTISLDYRDAPAESLEAELEDLHFQHDKSFHIFDALRGSLSEIQFYDTVTNLKLETTPEDGQLHVHVREDANEIIDYPSALSMEHINCDRYLESDILFHSHISGFVYKVMVDGKIMIKKEIPGPDTIEEFLYEVNALYALRNCENVIQLEGLITSNDGSEIRGLLIPYCHKGALVDVIYDRDPDQMSLELRLKWARQIIQGLSNIHEAGFVQGDFTLSNIVIDGNDDAHLIDINRRGCPVGWEPPELSCLIEQGQRISMYIGVKTDLFQLGMVLWALAKLNDEPERCRRPLSKLDGAPSFYQDIVSRCLSDHPQARPSAAILLRRMDRGIDSSPVLLGNFRQTQFQSYSDHTSSTHRSSKEYINPNAAVTIEDVKGMRHGTRDLLLSRASNRYSGSYYNDDPGSPNIPRSRGRSPGCSSRRRSSFFDGATTSATSVSASSGPHERLCHDAKDAKSYPQEIRDEDFDDKHYDMLPDLQEVPPLHHRVQHEDSGFDERVIDELYITTEPKDNGTKPAEGVDKHLTD